MIGKEGIVRYALGTVQDKVSGEGFSLHRCMQVTGVDQVVVPEHGVFVLMSDVDCVENWGGDAMINRYLAGDLAFLPAGTELRSTPSTVYGENLLRIRQECFESAAISADIDAGGLGLPFMHIRLTRATMAAFAVQGAMFMGERACALAVEQACVDLAEHVLRQASSAVGLRLDRLSNALSDERRRRVVEYVAENYRRPIGLAELAGVAALSPHHFCRSFLKSFGSTPMQYVAKRRVEAAKLLLRTETPLVVVAAECGFASQSHMNMAFKKLAGVTPGEYRRASF